MSRPKTQHVGTSEAAIFSRVWETGEGGLTPTLARHLLKLGFAEQDLDRMRELNRRHLEGDLVAEEIEELDSFIRVGDLLAVLQSKARKLLKRNPSLTKRHG